MDLVQRTATERRLELELEVEVERAPAWWEGRATRALAVGHAHVGSQGAREPRRSPDRLGR